MQMKAIVAAGIAMVAAVIAVLVLTRKDASPEEGVLIYGRGAETTVLDPQEMQKGEDVKVAENIFETLVRFGARPPEVKPCLATSWKVSEDAVTWTFALREGVRFHDGTQFDSNAVVFAIERLLHEAHPNRPKTCPYAANYANVIERVEADGPASVRFHLKRPSAVFLQLLAIFPASIPSPSGIRDLGDGFTQRPAGTGPFRLGEWAKDSKLELVRNDSYWGDAPALSKIVYLPIASPQTAIEKIRLGEIHMMDHVPIADVHVLEKDGELRVERIASPNVAYLAFNMSPEAFPYNDPHFRRAVSYALDLSVLNDLVYYGQAVVATNIVPPSLWADAAPLPAQICDLGKAKEELSKVALPPGFVAEVWHWIAPRDYMQEPHRVAEFVKDQLLRIGLDVKIQSFEGETYLRKTEEKTHPMCLFGWMADYPDADNFINALLAGSFAGDLNISFFDHAEFNRLVADAAVPVEWEKRRPLYEAAARIYREEIPSIPLVHTQRILVLRKGVRYTPHPIDYRVYEAAFEATAAK